MTTFGSQKDKADERKLQRIERTYESDTEYRRKANRSLEEARQLLEAGKIDHEHYELLRDRIKEKARDEHKVYVNKLAKRREEQFDKKMQNIGPVIIIGFFIFMCLLLSRCMR